MSMIEQELEDLEEAGTAWNLKVGSWDPAGPGCPLQGAFLVRVLCLSGV